MRSSVLCLGPRLPRVRERFMVFALALLHAHHQILYCMSCFALTGSLVAIKCPGQAVYTPSGGLAQRQQKAKEPHHDSSITYQYCGCVQICLSITLHCQDSLTGLLKCLAHLQYSSSGHLDPWSSSCLYLLWTPQPAFANV